MEKVTVFKTIFSPLQAQIFSWALVVLVVLAILALTLLLYTLFKDIRDL